MDYAASPVRLGRLLLPCSWISYLVRHSRVDTTVIFACWATIYTTVVWTLWDMLMAHFNIPHFATTDSAKLAGLSALLSPDSIPYNPLPFLLPPSSSLWL